MSKSVTVFTNAEFALFSSFPLKEMIVILSAAAGQTRIMRENPTTRILLDTTYLLPIFGIDTGLEQFDSKFPKIAEKFEVLYNQVSLIEVKWTVLALLEKEKQIEKRQEVLETYIAGLEILGAPEQRLKSIMTITLPQAEKIADYLLFRFDLRDYFDRLVYASAALNKSILLTQNGRLKAIQEEATKRSQSKIAGAEIQQDEFFDEKTMRPIDVLSWTGLLQNFRI
jgi:hypothetical protein